MEYYIPFVDRESQWKLEGVKESWSLGVRENQKESEGVNKSRNQRVREPSLTIASIDFSHV